MIKSLNVTKSRSKTECMYTIFTIIPRDRDFVLFEILDALRPLKLNKKYIYYHKNFDVLKNDQINITYKPISELYDKLSKYKIHVLFFKILWDMVSCPVERGTVLLLIRDVKEECLQIVSNILEESLVRYFPFMKYVPGGAACGFAIPQDIAEGETIKGHLSSHVRWDWSPDNRMLATVAGEEAWCSRDRHQQTPREYVSNPILVWNTDNGNLLLILNPNSGALSYNDIISFNSDGTRILCFIGPGYVTIWDVENAACMFDILSSDFACDRSMRRVVWFDYESDKWFFQDTGTDEEQVEISPEKAEEITKHFDWHFSAGHERYGKNCNEQVSPNKRLRLEILEDGRSLLYDNKSNEQLFILGQIRVLASTHGSGACQPEEEPKGKVEEPLPKAAVADKETDRFTDLVLHRGFYHLGDVVKPARLLAATEALEPYGEYTLEVAIRREPKGVESEKLLEPVRNPRKGREDVTIYAVVECRQPNAPDFKDAVLRLTWPFESDSTPAFFRFETGPALPPEPLRIEVRLYAEAGLQLLDLLELTYASGQWTKVRPDTGPAAIAAPPSSPVKDAVTFHITGAPNGFGIKAMFKRNGKVQLEAPLGRAIQTSDLENLLLQVRNYWTRLVIGKMSTRRQLSEAGYAQALKDIVKLGGKAWQELFGDPWGVTQRTPEAVGQLMRNAPLPPDSPVRVTLASDADTFVFPWAILCPPLRRKEALDPGAIWGLRYLLELTLKDNPDPYGHESGERVSIATTIDPGFAGSVDHAATLARIAALGPGAEFLYGNSEDTVLDRLEAVPPADIYYYFCHGISPGRGGSLNPDVVAEIEKTLANLSQAETKPWETLLLRIKSDPVEASMFTGAAEITEYELRQAEFFHGRRPIVFLNMCHSADLLPLMRKGLTRVFIDRQAAAVLGPECPVTSIFADMFAEQILTSLLTGQTIGEAVLAARRHFHAHRNPLGLLYTLYGHGAARVTDPSAN